MDFDQLPPLGATGQFPYGKVRDDDLGELRAAIAEENGKLVIHFGPKPITWIALTREQALELSDVLRARAERMN